MHRSLHIACLFALTAAACSDDAPKPSVSADTSWQVYCARTGGRCQRSLGSHFDREDEPDIEIAVTCQKLENGLSITLNDPGNDLSGSRTRSTLEITRLDPSLNRCSVSIDETTAAGRFKLTGSCGSGTSSACQVTGKLDDDGWSFDGTLSCDGLSESVGMLGDFGLAGALSGSTEPKPMVLKIANCK